MKVRYTERMEKNKAYLAMLFIQFVYAGMALLSKAAISKGMNPYVFVVYRQAFASIALSPFAFFDSKQAASLSCTLLCKIFLVSLFGVESFSIKHVHGLAKILGSIVSLCGAIIFALVKGHPLDFMKWFPANHSSQVHSKGDFIKGPIMMLSANIAWSLWLILQGFIVKQYPAKFRLTSLQCFFSCIQSAIIAVSVDRNPSTWKLGWDIHLLSVAYCGVIVTGICYWLQVCTIEEKGPVFTAMFTPLALIITAIFSALLWKETLYWGSVGGTILLVVGLYSVLWGKSRESLKEKSHEEREEAKLEETRLECIIHSTN